MKKIQELLEQISDEKLRKRALLMYAELKEQFDFFPAAVKKHHTGRGGLNQHVMEVMNLALDLFDQNPAWYNCSRDDVILVSFIHDMNKIDGYTVSEAWQKQKYNQDFVKSNRPYVNETARTVRMCQDFGILLSDYLLNAITFHHMGWSVDMSSPYGHVNSEDVTALAILIHAADMISSQILGRNDFQTKEVAEHDV